ncbi:FtsQ-type POTRA domain-containing protein [Arthrobacter sp. ZGTC131]|uniref:FtsQ-type POTRA domain-containing protein n=1 Tax=Arthrobacter sp. ZGTC131 TaxID=2058898 RepID=UPI000CE459FA|nr:FtsQ-type POTRA domain-containing protein [Arthrobacter sp. ZGTC131]
MASSRRPTYKPVQPGSRDKAPDTGEAAQPGVISASKSAPPPAAPDNQRAKRPSGTQGSTQQAPGRQSVPAGTGGQQLSGGKAEPGNVLVFPEPRGKRLRRNVIVAACIIAALVAGLLLAAVYSPVLAVRTVTVSGTKLLKPAQVQAALKPLLGTPLPQVSDEDVNALLKPLVQIKSVTTQAHPPSVLVVQVHERVPVALVKRGKEYLLVDVDGVRLGATAAPESVKLPVIDGGAGTIGKDLFQATTAVLGALPANVLAKLSNASAKSVDAVELKLVDGQTIIWGNAGEKELKARVLEALLKVPADPASPVNIYDVSVPRHPVTR